ncbi:MAG: DUF4142 domain-containing protein [Spongiibacteraceae bacterium]|nr:DUF4142 domain-containing protein [Spongiibacteraceae bacterium]
MRALLPALLCLPLIATLPLAHAEEQDRPVTQDQRDNPRLTDELFVTKAGQANLAEIQLSRKALEKSSSEAVIQYAERMIEEHTRANATLKAVAGQLGLQMPTELDIKDQTALSKLDALEGNWFDEEYAEHMIAGHRRTLALFEAVSNEDHVAGELRRLASELLPLLQKHHAEATQLKETIE